MSSPEEHFKINLNQNLWGLLVGLVALGFASTTASAPCFLVLCCCIGNHGCERRVHDVRIHKKLLEKQESQLVVDLKS